MKNKIFFAFAMLGLLTSCVKDLNNQNAIPTPGNEVILSASVNTPATKTVYGAEGLTTVPVKWVHNDVISVFGTTCSLPQADYVVKTYQKVNGEVTDQPLTSTPNTNADGQNYADELVRKGASGVQWGTESMSDFYAVYPAAKGTITPILNSQKVAGVKVPASVSSQQYNSFSVVNNVLVGSPFHTGDRTYGMDDAIMYAYTKDATPTDANGNPKTVDLNFKPFSTVLQFHIGSWHGDTASGLQSDQTGQSIKVTNITLQAPYNIAGDFTLSLNGSKASAEEGTTNKISITPAEEIVWTYGQALEFSVFVIPVAGQTLSSGWKVTITANDGSRTFSLKPTSTADNKADLEPGMIHKLNVAGFPVAAIWKYDPATWITTVPRNIYISDLSLPGAWYATDNSYQNATLQQQYNAGVRAFNIDCRLTLNTSTSVGKANGKTGSIPNYFNEVWREYVDNAKHVQDGTLVLACSGTEDGSLGNVSSIGKTVKQALKELGVLAQGNPNEYVEAIITVAQKPFDENTGYKYIRGTVNPQMVLTAIVNVLKDSEVAPYIYGSAEGEVITPETTVGDVRGKVVVKVNLNTDDAHLRAYNYGAPMLISEGSMASSAIGYISGDVVSGSFTGMNTAEMYWSNSYPQSSSSVKQMKYYYHQAQATTGTPTVANRKAAIKAILSKSYEIYSRNTHDAMFQLGIGGWTSDGNSGKTNLSSELNPYVYGIINSMLTGAEYEGQVYTPAPVGAVLMNFATSTSNSTPALIKAIIDLNGKYFLNRDTTKPAWPNQYGGSDEGGQSDPNQGNGSGGGSEGDQGEV